MMLIPACTRFRIGRDERSLGSGRPIEFACYATPTDRILPFEGPGPGLPMLLQSSTVGALKGGMESGCYTLCKRNKNRFVAAE